MARMAIFEWDTKEYTAGERGNDWYWALGIVAAAAAVASILFGNILLAFVILAGAGAIGLQVARAPRVHRFAIFEDGLAIDDRLYLFSEMLDFSILEYVDPELPPALSIKTKHVLSPHLLIPIVGHDPMRIYEYLNLHVPDGFHETSILDRFIDAFGL